MAASSVTMAMVWSPLDGVWSGGVLNLALLRDGRVRRPARARWLALTTVGEEGSSVLPGCY